MPDDHAFMLAPPPYSEQPVGPNPQQSTNAVVIQQQPTATTVSPKQPMMASLQQLTTSTASPQQPTIVYLQHLTSSASSPQLTTSSSQQPMFVYLQQPATSTASLQQGAAVAILQQQPSEAIATGQKPEPREWSSDIYVLVVMILECVSHCIGKRGYS